MKEHLQISQRWIKGRNDNASELGFGLVSKNVMFSLCSRSQPIHGPALTLPITTLGFQFDWNSKVALSVGATFNYFTLSNAHSITAVDIILTAQVRPSWEKKQPQNMVISPFFAPSESRIAICWLCDSFFWSATNINKFTNKNTERE